MEIKARDLYPEELKRDDGKTYIYSLWIDDYGPILRSFGKILLQVDDDNHQGDSRVIYKKNGQYGFLFFGWGSCSGCDELQACASEKDVDELIVKMRNDIKWFDSKEELKEFLDKRDWEGYGLYGDETKKFLEQYPEILRNE